MSRSRYEITLLTKMWKKPAIGMDYKDVEDLMGGIPVDQRDNARDALDQLVQDGIVGRKKKGEVAAIRSKRMEDVRDILRDEVPDYVLDLR